jgi:hypothetical protein
MSSGFAGFFTADGGQRIVNGKSKCYEKFTRSPPKAQGKLTT